MKTLSRNTSLAAAFVAAVTFGLPAAAQAQTYSSSAQHYENCKKSDTSNQIVGGLLGAVAGGVFGSQVSGNGARSEGSAIGAVLGAAAGAGIAGDKRNCRQESAQVYASGYSGGSSYPTTYNGGNTYGTTYRSTPTRTYGGTTRTTTTYSSGPSRTYGGGYTTTSHNSRPVNYGYNQGVNRVENIKDRIDGLRAERDRLQAQQRYGYSHHRAQRIAQIGQDLNRLKDRKRRVKNRTR